MSAEHGVSAEHSMSVQLTPMTDADLDDVMTHEDELFATEAWSKDSYRAELADRRYRFYLCARDQTGQLLGWGGIMVIGPTAQLLTVGVVRAHQRQGVGQQLLDALTQTAREREATEMILEVRVDNEPARRMYDRDGYQLLRVRRGYYDLGRTDAWEMRREL